MTTALLILFQSCTFEKNNECISETSEKKDTTLYVYGENFKGVIFTSNRSMGIRHYPNGVKREIDLLRYIDLPDSARFWKLSLKDICQFEQNFDLWWENISHAKTENEQTFAKTFRSTDFLLRQYVGYEMNDLKQIRVYFFNPSVAIPRSSWIKEPFILIDGWPDYFTLTYTPESENISLEL